MDSMIALIARPRSGTTALREVLKSNPRISTLGEIFHNDSIGDPHYFYTYFLKRVRENPDLCLPSADNRRMLFTDYVRELRANLGLAEKPNNPLIVGVNYNSLHTLNYYWQNPFSPPFLFQLFRKAGFGIIHLVRKNLLNTLISEERARKSGVWHIRDGGSGAEQAPPSNTPAPVELKISSLLDELEERQFEIDYMRKCLRGYPRALEIAYEETYGPDNVLSSEVLNRCAAFLRVPNQFEPATAHRRTGTATQRESVANYDAVAQALHGTRFEQFLDAEAGR